MLLSKSAFAANAFSLPSPYHVQAVAGSHHSNNAGRNQTLGWVIEPLHILFYHTVRAELPANGTHGGAHNGQPARR